MTYAELIESLAVSQQYTKKWTREMLEDFFQILALSVWMHKRMVIPGLGTFTLKQTKSRRIRNPKTNGTMVLPARWTVKCRVAREWRTK